MNFDEKNGLNFDFDTPLEEIEAITVSTDEDDAFDLAILTSSNEKKNSSIKRNRINEDILKDKSIEREQAIFDMNREKHAAQNAAVRTAPHAITAEELMRGKKPFKFKPEVVETEKVKFSFEPDSVKHADLDTENEKNYSDAAQMLFEKLRNRKSDENNIDETIETDVVSAEIDEKITVLENIVSDLIDVNDESTDSNIDAGDAIALEDIFGTDDAYENTQLVESSIDEVDDFTAAEIPEIVFDTEEENGIDDTENVGTDNLDIPVQPLEIVKGTDLVDDYVAETTDVLDIPVQPLFVQDDEEMVVENDVFFDRDQYTFESDLVETLPDVDGFIDNDGLFDEIEFESDVNDNYEAFDNEFDDDSDARFAYQDDIEYADDIGFDLPENDNYEDAEFDDMPNPVYDDFEGLDDEILTDISPMSNIVNHFERDYLSSVEYNDIDDDYDVNLALNKEKQTNIIKMSLSFVIALVLTCLSVGFLVSSDFFGTVVYWICTALSAVILLAVNFKSSMSFASIKDNDFKTDLLPATLTIASVIQSLFGILSIDVGNINFALVGAVIFGIFSLVKLIRLKDVSANFAFICNEDEKNLVSFIEKNESNKIIDSKDEIDYRIAYRKSTSNITEFVKNSMSLGAFEGSVKNFYIGSVIASLILAIIFAVSCKSAGLAIFGFCFGLAIASPISALIMTIVSIRRVNGALKKYRVTLFGYSSAENIDNTNVVTVDASDLFNKNNVKLYNIKTFGGLSLDRAIIDASALLSAANSPMMNIFNDIAEGESIPEADSVNYEDRMGLSGWVGGRKTLIGCRTIMETHNIDVPSIEVDRKIYMNGYFPVYMASEGKLSALFVVGYNADASLSYYVKRIFNSGLTLLVKTCDPNITEDMVANYYGIDRDSVKIASHESEIRMEKANTSNNATIICDNIKGYLSGIISSINLIKFSRYLVIAQFIITALAFMLFGISAATGSIGLFSYVSLVIYNIINLSLLYIFNSKHV